MMKINKEAMSNGARLAGNIFQKTAKAVNYAQAAVVIAGGVYAAYHFTKKTLPMINPNRVVKNSFGDITIYQNGKVLKEISKDGKDISEYYESGRLKSHSYEGSYYKTLKEYKDDENDRNPKVTEYRKRDDGSIVLDHIDFMGDNKKPIRSIRGNKDESYTYTTDGCICKKVDNKTGAATFYDDESNVIYARETVEDAPAAEAKTHVVKRWFDGYREIKDSKTKAK